MNGSEPTVPELPRPTPTTQPPRPPAAPLGRETPRFPEPPTPTLRPEAGRVCVNCAGPVAARGSTPLCWGCGRTLCADCYWRHGLTPSAHLCTGCAARGLGRSMAISGGHAPRSSVSGASPSKPA